MSQDRWSHTRPNAGVTVVPFIYEDGVIKTLFYVREDSSEVFPGQVALPNLFYDIDKYDTAEQAAHRALVQKAGVDIEHMEQVYTFTGKGIDPRRTTVNIAFMSALRKDQIQQIEDSSDKIMFWKPVEGIIYKSDDILAFNHMEVLRYAYDRLKAKAEYTPLALKLLNEEFTIKEFRELTELLLGIELNNARFRDRIQQSDLLIATNKKSKESFGAPAMLYRKNPHYEGNFFPRSMTKVK